VKEEDAQFIKGQRGMMFTVEQRNASDFEVLRKTQNSALFLGVMLFGNLLISDFEIDWLPGWANFILFLGVFIGGVFAVLKWRTAERIRRELEQELLQEVKNLRMSQAGLS